MHGRSDAQDVLMADDFLEDAQSDRPMADNDETQDEILEEGVLAAPEQQVELSALEDASSLLLEEFNENDTYVETPLASQLTVPENLNPIHATMLRNLYRALKYDAPTSALRPHQVNALNQYCNGLMKGQLHAVVAMTMGTGKTVIASFLTKYMLCDADGNRISKALITTSKKVLVDQIYAEIKTYCGELKIAIYKKHKDWKTADIVIATDAAIKLANIKEIASLFKLVIADEAHKSLGETGVKLFNGLRAENCIILPLTATPVNDNKLLNQLRGARSCYELVGITDIKQNSIKPLNIVVAAQVLEITSPVRSAIIKPKFDSAAASELQNQTGEIHEEQLGRIINIPSLNRLIAHLYANGFDPVTKKRYLGRQAIVFCAGVNHAEDAAAEINQCINIDDAEFLERVRESYVNNAYLKSLEEGKKDFNRNEARNSFRVAAAIHAGEYSVTLHAQSIAKALEKNVIEFTNPRTNEEAIYTLTAQDRQELLKQQAAGKAAKIAVLPKLNKAQKKAIIEQFEAGGILILTGSDMLIEGANFPNVCTLINARGTQSLTLEAQRCGRVLRKVNNKVANIIEFALDCLENQVFFYDVAGGKMALGKQDQPEVDESHIEFIAIPDVAAASELTWGHNETMAGIVEASKRVRKQRKLTMGTERAIRLPVVIEKITKVIDSLAPKLDLLETQLNRTVGFVHAPKPPEQEVEEVVSNRRIPAAAQQVREVSVDEAATAESASIKILNRHAQALVTRLTSIMESIKDLDEDTAEVESKRRRGVSENPQAAPVIKPAGNPVTANLKHTLTNLTTLYNKLVKLTTANMTNHAVNDASQAVVTAREEKEDDVANLLEDIVTASGILETAQSSIDVQAISQQLQTLAARKAEREEARHQATSAVVENPSVLPSIPVPPVSNRVDTAMNTDAPDEIKIEERDVINFAASIRVSGMANIDKYLAKAPGLLNVKLGTNKADVLEKVPAIYYAMLHHRFDVVEKFIDLKANIHHEYDKYINPLDLVNLNVSPALAKKIIAALSADPKRLMNETKSVQGKDGVLRAYTPLQYASALNKPDLCRVFIELGAEVTDQTRIEPISVTVPVQISSAPDQPAMKQTAVSFASELIISQYKAAIQSDEPYRVAEILHDHPYLLNQLLTITKDGNRFELYPIYYAASHQKYDVLIYFLSQNSTLDHSMDEHFKWMFFTITPASVDKFRYIFSRLVRDGHIQFNAAIQHKVFQPIDGSFKLETTLPLHHAAFHKRVAACALMLEFGADPHALLDGKTFLDVAAPEIKAQLERLISKQFIGGEPVIPAAASVQALPIPLAPKTTVKLKPTARTRKSPADESMNKEAKLFRLAIKNGDTNLIDETLLKYPDWLHQIPSKRRLLDQHMSMPIYAAFSYGNLNSINTLLNKGINPIQALVGYNPVILLLESRHVDWKSPPWFKLIETLIVKFNFDLNRPAYHQYEKESQLTTALHAAAEFEEGNAFKLLLLLGADPRVVCNGKTCLDVIANPAFRTVLVSTVATTRSVMPKPVAAMPFVAQPHGFFYHAAAANPKPAAATGNLQGFNGEQRYKPGAMG